MKDRTRRIAALIMKVRARWLGIARQKEVAYAMGISPSSAGRLCHAIEPDDAELVFKAGKAYATDEVTVSAKEAETLLRLLRGQSLVHSACPDLVPWLFDIPFDDLEAVADPVPDPRVLRAVLIAIKERRSMRVSYVSRGRSSEFDCSPTRLVRIYGRLHVRAFHHEKERFVDLVLARVEWAEVNVTSSAMNVVDSEWHGPEVILRFRPNPDMPDALKQTVANEWRGQLDADGCIRIRCRPAVAIYVKRRMQAPTSEGVVRWIFVEDSRES